MSKSNVGYLITKLIFFLTLLSQVCFSQRKMELNGAKRLVLTFTEKKIEYEEYTTLTNVLKIVNRSNYTISKIKAEVSVPEGIRSLYNSDKEYSIKGGDSVFIPIRLLPEKKIFLNGTSYAISVNVKETNGGQNNVISFFVVKKQQNKISLLITPSTSIYLRNKENAANFQVSINNESNENQLVFLTLRKSGKDLVVTDSAGKLLQREFLQLNLNPYADTVIPFKLKVFNSIRNLRRVDNFNYCITKQNNFNSSVYIVASKPNSIQKKIDSTLTLNQFRVNKTIKFIKLGNSIKVNPYGSNCLPVTFISSINFFRIQPVSSNMLYGNYMITANSNLSYYLQSSFMGHSFSENSFKSVSGNLIYSNSKINLQLGNSVNLNMPYLRMRGSGGTGISGSYKLSSKSKIGIAISKSTTFSNGQNYNFAFGFSAKVRKLNYGFGYDYQNNNQVKINTISTGLNVKLSSRQILNLQLGIDQLINRSIKTYAEFVNANYQITYNKKQSSTNINYSFIRNPYNFDSNRKDSILFNKLNNFNLQNRIILPKGQFQLLSLHTLSENDTYASNNSSITQLFITNSLTFLKNNSNQDICYLPGVFLNYGNNLNQKLVSTGVQLGISNSNYEKYFRVGANFSAAYNKLINYKNISPFFTSKSTVYMNYRVWNVILNYQFGPYTQGDVVHELSNGKPYFQNMNLRLNHQYQFKSVHFLLENNFVYSYLNTNNRNAFNIYSQLFYYAENGWRFDINVNWGYAISESLKYSYLPGSINSNAIETNPQRTNSVNYVIGFGLKKDFSIPISKKTSKIQFANLNVKVYLDLNGNLKFDGQDLPIENVVVALNQFECQTEKGGNATFININKGNYKLKVLSLDDIGAWFPVIKDSISIFSSDTLFIPFVKGVEVIGNVVIDREKYSLEMKGDLDISRLRIVLCDTAGNTLTSITDAKGKFSFYVPYNKYNLKFDETILGRDLELVENNIPIDLDFGIERYYYSFHLVEKRKSINTKKFNSSGQQIDNLSTSFSPNVKAYKMRYLDSLTSIVNKNLVKPMQNGKIIQSIESQVDTLSSELNVGFTLKLEVLNKDQFPGVALKQLIRLNMVDSVLNKDGSKEYFTGFYNSIKEAEKTANQLQDRGIKRPIIITKSKK